MSNALFNDFSAKTLAEWQAKIEKDLKGKPLSSLHHTDADNNLLEPAYTDENTSKGKQPFKAMAKWDTVQEIFVEDAKSANKEALDHLNRGATSLLFYLYDHSDLEVLLSNIQLQFIRSNFVVEGDALKFAERLLNLIKTRGLNPAEIAGSVNIDILESLARTGNWLMDETADFSRVGELYRLLPPALRSLCVNANLFANAGATSAQQLGIALSMSYEYIHRLELTNTQSFWINLAIGNEYFAEIAKLRAFRRLWLQLHQELGFAETEAFLYCETGMRNKTILDRYNNMVRSTSEAMAAVIGGANEISVKGFNHTYTAPDAFGERIAKNQLSLLEHESHLTAVRDMAQGAYFIEQYTETLAEKGWEFFKSIEAEGGYVESMKTGWLQAQIEAAAAAEQAAFDKKEKVLIGANKYAKADEDLKAILEHPMFAHTPNAQTSVKPLVPKRLSEALEK
jgi:methylmalonyl-CoA mutase